MPATCWLILAVDPLCYDELMKKAIILHGKPSKEGFYNPERQSQSNCHWLPWLQHELVIRDILAQTPELPFPFEPDYAAWKQVFEQLQPDEETILVGHSTGGGFLVRWLSENKDVRVGKVALVAPSLALEWEDTKQFMQFEIDPNLATRTAGITIVWSDDDKPRTEAVKLLSSVIHNIHVIELHGMGHLTEEDMHRTNFPELLEVLLKD